MSWFQWQALEMSSLTAHVLRKLDMDPHNKVHVAILPWLENFNSE